MKFVRLEIRQQYPSPVLPNIYIWSFVALAIVVGVFVVWTFNKLVSHRNQLREAWSGIDVQLKRRHDLVPNLVECVKGYRGHEQTVFENVAHARSLAQSAQGISSASAAENELTRGLRSVFALAEAYPDLKATQNFQQLSASLVEIEDNIQYARRYYNGSVRDFNNVAQTFPSLLVARAFNFMPADFFEIETVTERLTPQVKL